MEKSIGKNKILLRKKGEVVGDKMDKTIAVSVVSFETHPKYKKKYKVIKRYKAHDPKISLRRAKKWKLFLAGR